MAESSAKAGFTRVPSRATQALIADALVAAGLPGGDAARCAALMTEADLTGADRRPRHFPAGAICAPLESRRVQQAAQYHGE
jgi:hypothetical protein